MSYRDRYGRRLEVSRPAIVLVILFILFLFSLIGSIVSYVSNEQKFPVVQEKSVKIDIDPEKIIAPTQNPASTPPAKRDSKKLLGILCFGFLVALLLWSMFGTRLIVYERGLLRTRLFRSPQWFPFWEMEKLVLAFIPYKGPWNSVPGIALNDKLGGCHFIGMDNFSGKTRIRERLAAQLQENFPTILVEPGKKKLGGKTAVDFDGRISGNLFTSFNFWLFLTIAVGFPLLLPAKDPIALVLVLALFGFVVIGSQLFYPVVRSNSIQIRNFFFFWYRNEISFEAIHFVREVQYGRLSAGLELFLNDYRVKWFSMGTLREKHWRKLIQVLEAAGATRFPILQPKSGGPETGSAIR